MTGWGGLSRRTRAWGEHHEGSGRGSRPLVTMDGWSRPYDFFGSLAAGLPAGAGLPGTAACATGIMWFCAPGAG